MVIRLDENYNAMTSTALLGYVGETNARPVSVEGMEIDGADRYVLTIDYGDGRYHRRTVDTYGRYTAFGADSQLPDSGEEAVSQ